MKKNVILLFLICAIAFCQPTVVWQKTIGTVSNDECYTIIQAHDNGYILHGRTRISNYLDIFTMKIDSSGEVQWSRYHDCPKSNYTRGIIQSSSGGYIFLAMPLGTGSYKYRLVKIDDTGILEWSNSFGSTSNDCAMRLIQSSDGGYVIAGIRHSDNPMIDKNIWIVKTDSLGNPIWSNVIGKSNIREGAYHIYENSKNEYVFLCTTEWETVSPNREDILILYVNSNDGTIIRSNRYDNGIWEAHHYIAPVSDSSFICVGSVEDFTSNYEPSITKVHTNGNVIFTAHLGTISNDGCSGYCKAEDGGYILVGYTGTNGNTDGYIVKCNSSGEKEYEMILGGTNFDTLRSIISVGNNEYIAAGFTTTNGATDSDIWLVKLKDSADIPEQSPETTVATSIPSGSYKSNIEINLVALSEGIEIQEARIYYAVDGMVPEAQDQYKYNSSIPLTTSGLHTIKAIAIDSSDNLSAVTTFNYIISYLPGSTTDIDIWNILSKLESSQAEELARYGYPEAVLRYLVRKKGCSATILTEPRQPVCFLIQSSENNGKVSVESIVVRNTRGTVIRIIKPSGSYNSVMTAYWNKKSNRNKRAGTGMYIITVTYKDSKERKEAMLVTVIAN